MSDLRHHLDRVRSAWRRTEMLKGGAVLLADVIVVVLALVALDSLYHFPAALRGLLLVGGLGVLAGTAFVVVVRPLRRELHDEDLALHVEARYPELKGTLISAVEYEFKDAESALQASLFDALVGDCLERAATVDFAATIDRQRLARRAMLAAFLLVFFLGSVAMKPSHFKHELARVLMPWSDVPLTGEESLAAVEREKQQELEKQLLAQAQAAKAFKLELKVEPGDAQVARGGNLLIRASANKVLGPFTLKYQGSDGAWKSLAMGEDPAHPEQVARELTDIGEAMKYRIAMGGEESPEFAIAVFDKSDLKELRLTYSYPAYTKLPPLTVAGDANVEAVEGTKVEVAIVADAPLRSGAIQLDGAAPIAMSAKGANAVAGSFTVTANGQYALSALDARGNPLQGLDARFSIRLLRDEPPKLDVAYPAIDSVVHPSEEIAFAATVSDDVALKEVRLRYFYNLEDEQVLKQDFTGRKVKDSLVEFHLDLDQRKLVEAADSIVFHFEAEDMKGQVTASDAYAITVRDYELFSHYLGFSETGATHAPSPPELITLIGALQNLENRRQANDLKPDELRQKAREIAAWLIDKHPKK